MMKDIKVNGQEGNIVAGTGLYISGLAIRTSVAKQACIAYILQEQRKALTHREPPVRIVFNAHIAAQYLELGLIT